jgi:hypothetical protein
MPSGYDGFEVGVLYTEVVGGREMVRTAPVPGQTITVRDVTDADPVTGLGAVALPDLASDADGWVAAGTLAVDAGRTVRFSWFRALDGRCGQAEQTTF